MKASLFITCLVDTFFPPVGESMVRVLRRQGVTLNFPEGQTCCGQPAFNSGYIDEARAVASSLISAFESSEYVVTPSGSCASMIHHYYPTLFPEGHPRHEAAVAFIDKVYEFSQFMVDVLGVEDVGARLRARGAYHRSCHMSRGLGVVKQPLRLLQNVRDLELVELPFAFECCGFGGTFAVKLPEVSLAMVDKKLGHIVETGADVLIGSDLACLMHMQGRMRRQGQEMQVMHVAQVLDQGVSR